MGLAEGKRQIREQSLGLLRRQGDGATRVEPGLKAAEEGEAESRHVTSQGAHPTTFDATFNARLDESITPGGVQRAREEKPDESSRVPSTTSHRARSDRVAAPDPLERT